MVIVIRVSFLLRLVNDSVFMFRRAVEAVQFERALVAAVEDIVGRAGGNDHRKAVAHRMFLSVQNYRSFACLEANKLIQLVDFFSDFFAGHKGHQYQLAVLRREEDSAIVLVVACGVFDVNDVASHERLLSTRGSA